MPSFPKPKFVYDFNFDTEISRLIDHKVKRKLPNKTANTLLVGSWNIANLGLQKRWIEHMRIISEIISWFDVIAIQEVNTNLIGLQLIDAELPSHYGLIFSDKSGNNERFAFIYDTKKIKQMELVGEVAIAPKDHRYIKLKNIDTQFKGFDRNPHLASFSFRNNLFILINVHSFFGSNSKKDIHRRALETYAISRYADLTGKSKHSFTNKIIALGDFNLPKIEKGDLIYQALLKRGLKLPKHSSKVYSNIVNDKMYDQIAFLPSLKKTIKTSGVFDFDNAIFPELWNESKSKFRSYIKYYLSDHRPIWMQLEF